MPFYMRPMVARTFGMVQEAMFNSDNGEMEDADLLTAELVRLVQVLHKYGANESVIAACLVVLADLYEADVCEDQIYAHCGGLVQDIVNGIRFLYVEKVVGNLSNAIDLVFQLREEPLKTYILSGFCALLAREMQNAASRVLMAGGREMLFRQLLEMSSTDFIFTYDEVAASVSRIGHPLCDEFLRVWLKLRHRIVESIDA